MTSHTIYRFGTQVNYAHANLLDSASPRACALQGLFREFGPKPVASVGPDHSMVIFFILPLQINIHRIDPIVKGHHFSMHFRRQFKSGPALIILVKL